MVFVVLNGFVPTSLFVLFEAWIKNSKQRWKSFNKFFTLTSSLLHVDFWKDGCKKYKKRLKRKGIKLPTRHQSRITNRQSRISLRSRVSPKTLSPSRFTHKQKKNYKKKFSYIKPISLPIITTNPHHFNDTLWIFLIFYTEDRGTLIFYRTFSTFFLVL